MYTITRALTVSALWLATGQQPCPCRHHPLHHHTHHARVQPAQRDTIRLSPQELRQVTQVQVNVAAQPAAKGRHEFRNAALLALGAAVIVGVIAARCNHDEEHVTTITIPGTSPCSPKGGDDDHDHHKKGCK